jgi:hypothetical protein
MNERMTTMIEIGIFPWNEGEPFKGCDVQISGENIYFEFGCGTVEEAQRVIALLKNAPVAVDPPEEWWEEE